MINRERGEYLLVTRDRTYVLQLTTNSGCELEAFAGRLFEPILQGAQKGSVRDMRLLLWAALREHHPEIATDDPGSLKTIGTIADSVGGLLALKHHIRSFMALNADSGEKEGGAAKAGARPPSPDGTGVSSTWTH